MNNYCTFTKCMLMECSLFIFSGNIEQIPVLLQSVIDHLVQWHVLPENRKPNGCIINYFEEVNFRRFSTGDPDRLFHITPHIMRLINPPVFIFRENTLSLFLNHLTWTSRFVLLYSLNQQWHMDVLL